MLRTHSLRGQGSLSSNAQSVPVVRVALAEDAPPDHTGLSSGVLAGIVVGSVLGGVVLIFLIGLLILCLCQRRKISADQTKPGTNSAPKLSASSSAWNCFRKRNVAGSRGRRVPPPIFGSDKQDPDDISDTSFVLPELGGPNPHNKFDGMEWVDIKGLDDEHLQDISTDLRKYQQGQQRRH